MMERDPRYRGDLREKAAELYRDGLSTDEVAAKMDLSRTRITQLLRESGVKMRRRGRPRSTKAKRSQRSQDAA